MFICIVIAYVNFELKKLLTYLLDFVIWHVSLNVVVALVSLKRKTSAYVGWVRKGSTPFPTARSGVVLQDFWTIIVCKSAHC